MTNSTECDTLKCLSYKLEAVNSIFTSRVPVKDTHKVLHFLAVYANKKGVYSSTM